MLGKRSVVLTVGLILALLIVPATVVATGEGTGADDAFAPEGTWMDLDAGELHWYAFDYDGEEGAIAVSMDAKPDDGVLFKVVTPHSLSEWMKGEDLSQCGCGTANDYESGDLFWTGSFKTPGRYYVVVEHTGNHDGPGYYALSVSGKGVSFEKEVAEQAAPVAAPAAAKMVEVRDVEAPSDWMCMDAGAEHWVEFRYDGDDSVVKVLLDSAPDDAATFSVWTPEQVRLYALGEDVDPIGRGAANDYEEGDQFWTGSFNSPGIYYIRVEQCDRMSGDCKLQIEGKGVSF
ncbi:MAG: hypothetical protein U9R25_14935 [Chloroflexota bacterium]|nr:hypothetical protein [Chloroflexota bacterium]